MQNLHSKNRSYNRNSDKHQGFTTFNIEKKEVKFTIEIYECTFGKNDALKRSMVEAVGIADAPRNVDRNKNRSILNYHA